MKTLYISDLDGTLLNSDARISQYTADTLNSLIEKGLLFSYATARSYNTAGEITSGITAHFPRILYNGTFVVDNATKQPIITNFFDDELSRQFVRTFVDGDVWPLVYYYDSGVESMAFIMEKSTDEMKEFIYEYEGTLRHIPASSAQQLEKANTYYLVCIDTPEKLFPLYEKLKDHPAANIIYQTDVYTGRQWLEIMPKAASKANAVLMLKEKLGCDRVVCFGDGKNDISMFNICDECYAVENAVEELKSIATATIGSNNADGVARWLAENGEY